KPAAEVVDAADFSWRADAVARALGLRKVAGEVGALVDEHAALTLEQAQPDEDDARPHGRNPSSAKPCDVATSARGGATSLGQSSMPATATTAPPSSRASARVFCVAMLAFCCT